MRFKIEKKIIIVLILWWMSLKDHWILAFVQWFLQGKSQSNRRWQAKEKREEEKQG